MFESNLLITNSCAVCAQRKNKIKLPIELYALFHKLAHAFNEEWGLFLTGEPQEDGWLITGYLPMKQHRDATDVTLVKGAPIPEQAVGTIHSHHNMKAYWSQTDQDNLLNNFNVNIVISRSGIKGAIRSKMPCEQGYYLDDNVEIELIANEASIEEAVTLIKENTVERPKVKYQQYYGSLNNLYQGDFDYYDISHYGKNDKKPKKGRKKWKLK